VLDERDRESERPLQPSGPGQRALPNEQSTMKTLCLVARSLDPKGTDQTRWVMRWKPVLNAFAITFADRIPAAQDC